MKTKTFYWFLWFIILLWLSFLTFNNSFWAKSVNVTAVVWSPNLLPIIESFWPTTNPTIVARNKAKAFFIQIKDPEWDDINYTVTPEVWSVNTPSWTLTWTTTSKYIDFTYLAPSTKPSPNTKKITVTISDWTNVIVKQFQVYIN